MTATIESIRDSVFETLDLDVAMEWKRKALAWAGKLDEEQMEHIATRLQLQATMRQAEQLESLVCELVEARDSFRLAAEDLVGRESTLEAELEEAQERIAELETKVALLTIAESATHYGAQHDLLVSLWRELDGEQEGDAPANHLMEEGLIQLFRSLHARIAALTDDDPHGHAAIYHGTLLWLLGPEALDHGETLPDGEALCSLVREVVRAHMAAEAACFEEAGAALVKERAKRDHEDAEWREAERAWTVYEAAVSRQLDEARTRIAELEAENGTLKGFRRERDRLHDILRDAVEALPSGYRKEHDSGVGENLAYYVGRLEAEVAALRDADTVDVPPVDPPDEDAHQYPRVEWGGGECPLPGDVFAYAQARDTKAWSECRRACEFLWGHVNFFTDIIAYRIAPDSEQTPEGLAALREYLRTHEPDGTLKP